MNKKGGVLIGAVLALILVGLIVPALILRIQRESRDTNKEKKKTTALQLAEAGQDRGAWKLRESGDMWVDASSGVVISGYNDDLEYGDIQGGRYKIDISSGPSADQVTIISKGKATGETDIRAIRAIYSKDNNTAIPALSVNSALNWRPNMRVHWGPVITYTSITHAPSEYYPRKYSAGQVTGRDTVNDATNGAMPGDNWGTYDYASFYDLGVPPEIKLQEYRDQAKALTGIPAMKNAVQTPAGSGYFTPTTTQGLDIEKTSNPKDYILNCPTCVLFIEGNVKKFPQATQLRVEALIITGNADFNADSMNLTVAVPCDASDEYQHSSLTGWFAAQGWADCGTANLTGVGMQGFLYVGGDLDNGGGGAKLHGALFMVGDNKINTFTIYYSTSAAANVRTGGTGQMTRDSWDEITTSW